MINKNFMAAMKSCIPAITSNMKDIDGKDFNVPTYRFASPFTASRNYTDYTNPAGSDMQGMSLLIGSDDTPATEDDIRLGNIITDYEVISQNIAVPKEYNNLFLSVTRVVKNNGEESISVKELGLLSSFDTSGPRVLFAREVLPAPVELQPGEKYTFTINVCIS